MGGTCVNRGCVSSRRCWPPAQVRELADADHLQGFIIHPLQCGLNGKLADHANQLVATIRANLTKTLERAGVTIIRGKGRLEGRRGGCAEDQRCGSSAQRP